MAYSTVEMQGGPRSRRQLASKKKKRQECPSTQSTSENYLFLALVHGVAVNKFKLIPFK